MPDPGFPTDNRSPSDPGSRCHHSGHSPVVILTIAFLLLSALVPALLKPAEFMQDDSYFYLQIAHNIVAGLGSSFNGITPTNGYHPLWLWIVTALSIAADGDKITTLYLVFLLQGFLAIVSLLILNRLTISMGLRHGLIALAVLSAYLLGTGIYGSEAHINALSLLAGLACLWMALGKRSLGLWFVTGCLFGIACLARLDNIFPIFFLSLFSAHWLARNDIRRAIRMAVLMSLGGSIVFLPYLISNLAAYGHLVPISGAIKSTFPAANPDLNNLGSLGKVAAPFGLVALSIGLFLDSDSRRRVIWFGLGTGVLLHAVYIICFTDHYTFWAWYYVSAVVTSALCASYLYEWLLRRTEKWISRTAKATIAIACAVLVLSAGSARAWLKAYEVKKIGPMNIDLRINEYRWPDEFGRWMKANLPAGSRIFVYDWPGALAYYSDLPLLPMDGLVSDYQYNDDLVRLGVHDYLCAKDVKYFFGLIEPWEEDIQVTVTAPLYRKPVGTLQLPQEDIIVRTREVLSRPDEALPFAIWRIHCSP